MHKLGYPFLTPASTSVGILMPASGRVGFHFLLKRFSFTLKLLIQLSHQKWLKIEAREEYQC